MQFRRVSHSDVMSFAVASFFTCDVFAVGSVYAYTCLFDVLGASTRTTFSATTKPCDRVPPSAHQAQRRLHWACPVGLCDACCAGWVGGVSCTEVHFLGRRLLAFPGVGFYKSAV